MLINTLSESQKRWWAAQKAMEIGRGGILKIQKITGISRPTIIRGIRELKSGVPLKLKNKSRVSGGGRKAVDKLNPKLRHAINDIVNATTAGDPMCALRWTVKSSRTISDDLKKQGFDVCHQTVAKILHDEGFTLQANYRTKEGKENPNRDEQFKFINSRIHDFDLSHNPVISVDGKKKEKIGNFKNAGETWTKKGESLDVNAYDYSSLSSGQATPYGTYDSKKNEGFVNVGTSKDTAEFAVNSISQWWKLVGRKQYPKSKELLICADGGGSNGSRNRGWKFFLQKFSNKYGLTISVCHYPPACSKWNKIEHRMFSFISINWRGRPLTSYETVINLIKNTTTRKGLKIRAKLDKKEYKVGIKISKENMLGVNIDKNQLFPNWNYKISPNN